MSKYALLLTKRPENANIPLIREIRNVTGQLLRPSKLIVVDNLLPSLICKRRTKTELISMINKFKARQTGGEFIIIPLRKDVMKRGLK